MSKTVQKLRNPNRQSLPGPIKNTTGFFSHSITAAGVNKDFSFTEQHKKSANKINTRDETTLQAPVELPPITLLDYKQDNHF